MDDKILSTKNLGLALRAARKKKKLSQAAAGSAVGMAQHTISAIEAGKPGTEIGTIFRVLAALDLELVVRPRQKANNNENKNNVKDSW
jgi:HTH-type transcriptional regulator/antitoxin HipB